jgi:hypothetical protein
MAFPVDLRLAQTQNSLVESLYVQKLVGDIALSRLGAADPLNAATTSPLLGNSPVGGSDQVLQELVMMLASLMTNKGNQGGNSSSGGGGSNSGSVSQISGSGGAGSSGSSAPMNESGAAGSASGSSQGAEASVKLAESKLGQVSQNVKMDNYTAAGGATNNCADFVSAILASTQGFKKTPGDASVATFEKNLKAQGWREVPKSQAKAGDVVIINGSQHTELVTKDGGTEAIGSNGSSSQSIKKDNLGWGTEKFLHKG